MAPTTAETRSHRRKGWLRRVEPETPLRLPLEPLRSASSLGLGVALLQDEVGYWSDLILPEAQGATSIGERFQVEQSTRSTVVLQLGPGGTVALERVDARAAAEAAGPRKTRTGEGGRSAGVLTRRPIRPKKLSLAERLLLVLQPPLEALLEPEGVLEWHAQLYPYQYDGVQALVESEALLLADDMGLGKTIQAIAAFRVLIHLRRAEQVLVVAPASLLSQWRHELTLWAPELRVTVVRGGQQERLKRWRARSHVLIVGYETLRADTDPLCRYGPSAVAWDVVVLDEAQKIKNPGTRASVACKGLPRKRAWALTGTPLENDVRDLASIIQFLTPFAVGDTLPALLEGDELLAAHRALQLRRKKGDVLKDLPPKSVNDIWLQLSGEQRASYERAERDGVVQLKELGTEVTISHVLALIQRLKQICNVCPASGESTKADDLSERLEQLAAEGQRALVFSQYTADGYGVRGLVSLLERFRPLAYHGSLSTRERDSVIQSFKTDARHNALVLSLRAGGQGLNLQEASYVFHFDRWWNPAVERQAEDRTHRLGQNNAVTVYKYICEGTIEERIDRILREKQALFDELVDKVTIDPGRLLGEKEIFGLFRLEPPKRGKAAAIEELDQ